MAASVDQTARGGAVSSSSSAAAAGPGGRAAPAASDELAKQWEDDGTNEFVSYSVCGTDFLVSPRYTIKRPLGSGAYGVVCAAEDRLHGKFQFSRDVAIKKIGKAFDHLTDCKRTLREIKILRLFDHENVIGIRDILRPRSFEEFEDVYIVSDMMDTDLHQIIGSKQPLTDDHCQYFMYQVLRGLRYVHSANVLHRDLKPSNILLNGNCDLKICDFGLARSSEPDMMQNFMTEYVATRWYRAPEIMLSWKPYTKAIDVWSIGCIFYEILARKPLFPGRDYIHQLNLITDVLGTPSDDKINTISSSKAKAFMKSMAKKPPQSFEQKLPNANPTAIHLLKAMLQFDPDDRITIDEALRHPYLEPLHDPLDEPQCDVTFDFPWEDEVLTKPMLKELIFKEMLHFHPEATNDPTYHPVLPPVPAKKAARP